ncbi:carbohydrate ABC transporter permease [Cohnella hashimotonis]|uniref:Carbohydrate ABC transporter permease n=1 Tax=Cohnella hashimotonis TaxID=2826895 RepID=A0ABT6TEA4_9BACL|nr:carbohydrate ABC transporter permease [Cohnella hashimotonis]MDI4645150.1 carbohydrate ABC transporter permease [Cohnella hashimotonis]
MRTSISGRVFDLFIVAFSGLFGLICFVPFLYVVAASFTAPEELLRKGFVLFPHSFSLDGYRYIFSTPTITRSLVVTIALAAIGTLINLLFTVLMAYPLARSDLFGRRPLMLMIVFTLIFSGGMIPNYLVVKSLHLLDSYWSLVLPGLINAFNLIVLKNFFQQLPDGLEESARIDGCTDFGVLFRIVLPLSGSALATFGLFYAVGHWNTFFNAILYLNDADKWPIQVWLRQIIILSQAGIGDASSFDDSFVVPPPAIIKMAVIVISTVPILLIYPFLQKHFAKGVLLGSVKG